MRTLTALLLICLAAPAAGFERPTRPTAPPPGSGPVTQPLAYPPAGMSGMTGEIAPAPVLRIETADAITPEGLQWAARPVVVFADTPEDPQFAAQMRMIDARPGALADRRVVVITDTDPAAASPWRQRLHPRGFSLVVIDTDGRTVTRKPLPWSAREIARTIDKLPSRREELGGR